MKIANCANAAASALRGAPAGTSAAKAVAPETTVVTRPARRPPIAAEITIAAIYER